MTLAERVVFEKGFGEWRLRQHHAQPFRIITQCSLLKLEFQLCNRLRVATVCPVWGSFGNRRRISQNRVSHQLFESFRSVENRGDRIAYLRMLCEDRFDFT